jgi:uncharacterized protein (TIGR02246 family)
MILARVRIALAILLFVSFTATLSWAQMSSSGDGDKAGVMKCVAAWDEAWNRHDAHATTMSFEQDGDYAAVNGEPSHGWKELEAHYNQLFTGFLKDAHRTDTVRSIRFLTPDVASVDIDWQLTGAKTKEGKDIKGLLTWIVTKHDGQWLITSYHETIF